MNLKQLFGQILFTLLLLTNLACASSGDSDLPAPTQTPKMRVETVATNLEVVWSIVFAPDGRMFFTERPGRVRLMENGKLRDKPFFTVPDIEPSGESGL
ncbi:MAG TPA: PQQ-dependent sugar dehydrogenase, partial [Pyrinomonadaceae bacterium]|nr:PQQ-dependent sugar dehydrogenase [Pyrinomonadaceae bacterium]